jgi:phenylpropionate dioxygenase-like ring-hydroxylating dioxygenase large terminal subunit
MRGERTWWSHISSLRSDPTGIDRAVNTCDMTRSPGITYQQLLDTDSHAVPEVLRHESTRDFGTDDVSIHRYIDRDWHVRERDHMWTRVWQFACREEHIPTIGDYIVYDIAGLSFIVISTEAGIKAYPNACLHRGRQLKDYDGHCSEIRCPFHGFAWTNEGDLLDVPASWDFAHVDDRRDVDFHLPECRVDTWAGFVFINPDPQAGPLADFLGGIVDQFAIWDLGSRYVEAHVSKVIEANWKIAQEAFCEAYHVNATHPQILSYLGDVNSQVDVWDHCSRVITAGGTPSPLLGDGSSEQDMVRGMLDVRVDQDSPITLADGQTARGMLAKLTRDRWRVLAGDLVDRMSDSEMVDSIDYTVFPNFHPWGAFNRIVYRFRPNGDDHRSAIMECFFLSPFKGERPPPAKERKLAADEPWSTATELGMLAKVFEQDVFNMAKVQKGLETTRKPGATFSNYQESKIRWLHDLLTKWVGDTSTETAVTIGTRS